MSEALPLVSIIIPTYNMRQWIGETLGSALAQTYPHCEIIVVDDGSTDGTGDFVRERYGDQIQYIYQDNRGRGAARNVGVAASKGDYIQFFDADDIMEPDALAARTSFLQDNPSFAVAYSRVLTFWEDDLAHTWENKANQYYESGDVLKQEIHHPFLLPIQILVQRKWVERVEGMDETLKSNEDWHFWLKIAAQGGQFGFVEGPAVARHRTGRHASVESGIIHAESDVLVLEMLKPLLIDRPDYHFLELDRAIATCRYGHGYWLLKGGQRWQAIRQIFGSLRHNREQLPAKLAQLVLGLFIPGDQIETIYLKLRALIKRGDESTELK